MGDLVPSGDPDITIFIVLTLVGFLIGVCGHLVGSTKIIVLGIVVVLTGTILAPLVLFWGGR